jgi:hypothetical protein
MSFFSKRELKLIVLAVVILFFSIAVQNVYAPPLPPPTPTYTISAHGNTSYGVNRTSIAAFGYSIGNCAHCHEQHASIGGTEPAPTGSAPLSYELFYTGPSPVQQTTFFCEYCHMDPNDPNQVQISMPYQYNYSRIAGGDNNTCPTNIRWAFGFINDNCSGTRSNCGSSVGSSHCLKDIVTFLAGKWGFSGGGIDPCSGCHNPHRTQRDFSSPPQSFVWTNGVSSLSRPSTHSKDNNIWTLWGDDSGERMSNYYYQAPYRFNSTTTYEPDDSGSDGSGNASRNVDSVALCTDCHNATNTITSSVLVTTLRKIDWNYEIHGTAYQVCCDYGDKKAPYSDATNYVLSCLDCHEPHGSPNQYLLREEVNGTHVGIFQPYYWYNFCSACHINLNKHMPNIGPTNNNCWGCHTHGAYQNRCGCIVVKTF